MCKTSLSEHSETEQNIPLSLDLHDLSPFPVDAVLKLTLPPSFSKLVYFIIKGTGSKKILLKVKVHQIHNHPLNIFWNRISVLYDLSGFSRWCYWNEFSNLPILIILSIEKSCWMMSETHVRSRTL